MGGAKRRGSYEQRKAEGQARHAEKRRQWEGAVAKREASMTSEERAKRRKAGMMIAAFTGIAVAALEKR